MSDELKRRLEQVASSEWFKTHYADKSLGESEIVVALEARVSELEAQLAAFIGAALYEYGKSGDGIENPGNEILRLIRADRSELAALREPGEITHEILAREYDRIKNERLIAPPETDFTRLRYFRFAERILALDRASRPEESVPLPTEGGKL